MGRSHVLRFTAIVLCIVCVMSLCGCDGIRDVWRAAGAPKSFEPVSGPVAVVLGSRPPRLMLVDPDTLQVRHEVKLRSLAIDIEVDGRYVVVPVCGPPGAESDTVVGVVDLSQGTVDYIDTGRLGPDRTWVADGGWALIMSSEVLEGGMSGFSLDMASLSGVPLTLPHGSGAGAVVGDEVWLVERIAQEGDPEGAGGDLVERVWAFSEGGEVREVVLDARDIVSMTAVADHIVLVRGYPASGEQQSLEILSRENLSEGVVRALTEATGPVRAVSALPGGRVGVLTGSDSATADPNGRLIVVDVETAQTVGVVDELDGAVALSVAGSRILVLCEESAELAWVDTERWVVGGRTRIGSEPYDLLDLSYSER